MGEEVKLDCLGRHFSGKAPTYNEQQVSQWVTQCSSDEEVMVKRVPKAMPEFPLRPMKEGGNQVFESWTYLIGDRQTLRSV